MTLTATSKYWPLTIVGVVIASAPGFASGVKLRRVVYYRRQGMGMRAIGVAISAVGLALLGYAWQLPTTLNEQSARILGLPAAVGDTDTLNIGLLYRQELTFDGGLTLLICGAVVFAAGATIRALHTPEA